MGERVGQIVKPLEVKKSSSNSRVRRTGRLHSMDTPVNRILYLQRTAGNQAVSRLMRSGALQAKLRIGQPGDIYEQEADRVADAVMRMPEWGVQRQVEPEEEEETLQTKPLADQITPLVQVQRQEEPEEEEMLNAKPLAEEITPLVQRQVEPEEEEEPIQAKLSDGAQLQRQEEEPGEEEEEKELQAKSKVGTTPTVTPSIESRINSLKGGGQPLDPATRNFFEPRIGHDFSEVRVHHGSQAAEIARSVSARAFTLGNSVMFGSGEYAPDSATGKRLLAHELTHVVQQHGGLFRKHRDGMSNLNKNRIPNSLTPVHVSQSGSRIQRLRVRTVENINNTQTSAKIGTRAGAKIAYGLTHLKFRHHGRGLIVLRTIAQRRGNRWHVWVTRKTITPQLLSTIYITSAFRPLPRRGRGRPTPAARRLACLYNNTLQHERRHVADAFALYTGQIALLQNDLSQRLPSRAKPSKVNSRVAARAEITRIVTLAEEFGNCAKNQACHFYNRLGLARDAQEYPNMFQGCPAPRPAVPPVPRRAPGFNRCRRLRHQCPRVIIT